MSKMQIFRLRDMVGISTAIKDSGHILVTTNGVFDFLHIGHIRYLQKAKALGDFLLVGVNSDSSVRQIKGKTRPYQPAEDRAEILAALECVDYVLIFEETTPCAFLEEIKPDIHVKGADYRDKDMPEREVVEGYGGAIALIELEPGKSTSDIISRIFSSMVILSIPSSFPESNFPEKRLSDLDLAPDLPSPGKHKIWLDEDQKEEAKKMKKKMDDLREKMEKAKMEGKIDKKTETNVEYLSKEDEKTRDSHKQK